MGNKHTNNTNIPPSINKISDKQKSNKPSSNTNRNNIFSVLGLQRKYEASKHLFVINKNQKIIKDECVLRMNFILDVYNKWIVLQRKQISALSPTPSDTITNITMFDILQNELHSNYTFQVFLNDYRFVTDDDRSAFGYFDVENVYQVYSIINYIK